MSDTFTYVQVTHTVIRATAEKIVLIYGNNLRLQFFSPRLDPACSLWSLPVASLVSLKKDLLLIVLLYPWQGQKIQARPICFCK